MLAELLTDVGIPGVVWLLMLVVGLELTVADFKRVLAFPKAAIVATLGQFILLPFIALGLIWLLEPTFYVAAGMILIAASPSGAISNFYTYLAKANLGLSISLTAIATLLALVAMPVITQIGFNYFLGDYEQISVPTMQMIKQLLIMLVLPVVVGMGVRHVWPTLVKQHGLKVRRVSLVAMVVLVALILFEQRGNFGEGIGEVVLIALLFSAMAMGTGWCVGLLARLPPEDRFTLLIEFGVRNLAVTAIVGIMVFGESRFALFAAIFFITQMPIVLILSKVFQKRFT